MKKSRKESFFWTSYSDLMTSLFFVMLVLFVLGLVLSRNANKELRKAEIALQQAYDSLKGTAEATQQQLDKIKELENSIKNIDTRYFAYDDEFKTHILKTTVKFEPRRYDIYELPYETRQELYTVRDLLKRSLVSFARTNPDASYLLIIEGQASADSYSKNNELSYQRALSLFNFWFPNQWEADILFKKLNCEVVIAGAGCMEGNKPRARINEDNQRFLIRILPKPGIIKDK